MNADQLLDLIGEADDNYIRDAAKGPAKKSTSPTSKIRRILLPITAAAAGVFLLMNIGGRSGSGGKEGLIYDYYTGPIFPLTVEADEDTLAHLAPGLTASRDITLDFSPYASHQETLTYADGETRTYEAYDRAIQVTDHYTLTNTTNQEITLQAVYPFSGRINQAENVPVITVNGMAVTASLASGTRFIPDGGFADYAEMLADGSYFADALDGLPPVDLPVTVYRLSDYQFQVDTEEAHPALQFSFQLNDPHTSVLTYEFEGGFIGQGSGEFRLHTKVDTRPDDNGSPRPQDPAYVILIGEDVPYTLQGYETSFCQAGEERNDLTCTVTRTETTLGQILYQLAAEFYPEADVQKAYELLAGDLYANGIFGPNGTAMHGYVELDSALHDLFVYYHRIMYLTFPITIPAGESITVCASARKEASYDHSGSRKMRNGYEVATQLGSCMAFTKQTATITGHQNISILDQNFGFDLRKGVTTVTFDPKVQQYWIQVRK